MNYSKIYNDLVAHRKQNSAKGYTENHHIVMRSMGGSDTDDNLVRLTGREHWIAHLLLYKIHCNSQTIHACNMMKMRCEERGIAYIKNSRAYEFIRTQHAKFIGDKNKVSHKGKGNPQYGTRWICNIQMKENKKIYKDQNIPDGWILGRNKWKPKRKIQTREKLATRISITNGKVVKYLNFIDQLPIPSGWWQGSYPCSEERKQKIKSKLAGKPRLYRRGLKHKRHK